MNKDVCLFLYREAKIIFFSHAKYNNNKFIENSYSEWSKRYKAQMCTNLPHKIAGKLYRFIFINNFN